MLLFISISPFPIPHPLPLYLSQVCQIVRSVNNQCVLDMDYNTLTQLIMTGPMKIQVEVMEEIVLDVQGIYLPNSYFSSNLFIHPFYTQWVLTIVLRPSDGSFILR